MDNERLYLMAMNQLTAVNKSDGSFAWESEYFHGGVFSEVAVGNGIVATGDDNSYIYILDAVTGKLIRRYHMNKHAPANDLSYIADFALEPTIVDDIIYFGWHNYLYAVQVPDL